MIKTTFIITILLISIQLNAQDWDKNYPEVDYEIIINSEQKYADSINNSLVKTDYYSRISKYRIKAKYTGQWRKLNNEVKDSMLRVFKFYGGNPEQLIPLLQNEYLFKINNIKVWMPIQNQLVDDLEYELEIGNSVTLYCLFTNEHLGNGTLFNTFLISEFSSSE